MKLTKLTQINIKPGEHNFFHPGIINNTNITFSVKETALLEKAVKNDFIIF